MSYPQSSLPYQVVNTESALAADILTKLKTVDGANSGLEADKVDGKEVAELFVKATDTADSILAGATTEVPPKEVATEAKQTAAGNPWVAPRFELLDPARFHLERVSGGRLSIRYSESGKVPIEVVWVDAFANTDVAPDMARARANSTAYVVGALIIANNQLYEVTTAGTSGSAAPSYPTEIGSAVVDGSVTLTLRVSPYDDTFPAFSAGGTKKDGRWYSRFMCDVYNGKPRSIAGQLPSYATIDQIRSYATAFGNGALPWTQWDYEALACDAFRKGVVPVGNTYYGRSHKTPEGVWGGIRGDRLRPGNPTGGDPRTRGGSAGPIWTHNRTANGVYDFVGNYWRWVDGVKLMDGQYYIHAYDNDPALLSTVGEGTWIATGLFVDAPVDGNDAGTEDLGVPKFSASVTHYTASVVPPRDTATIKADTRDLDLASQTWSSMLMDPSINNLDFNIRLALFRMGILPRVRSDGPTPLATQEGRFYVRNNGERFLLRGGFYSSNAGPKFCSASSRRSSSCVFGLGFSG